MRKSPLNVLAAIAIIGIFWVFAGILGANMLANSVSLEKHTVEEFVGAYRLTTVIIAAIGALVCVIWLLYGAREGAASELGRAWGVWLGLGIALVVVSAIGVAILILSLGEMFSFGNVVFLFAIASLLTWLYYWLCSLYLSPRAVQFVPLGRR